MQHHGAFPAKPAQPLQGLHRANLVVRSHDGDECDTVLQHRLYALQIHETRGLDRQDRRPKTLALQACDGLKHALVFGSNRDDMIEAVPLAAVPRGALDSEIVGFSRTRGEHDLAGFGIDQLRNFGTCCFDSRGGFPAERVGIDVRVPELLPEIRKHRVEHFRVERRGGLAIEINRMLWHHQLHDLPWHVSRGSGRRVSADRDRSDAMPAGPCTRSPKPVRIDRYLTVA